MKTVELPRAPLHNALIWPMPVAAYHALGEAGLIPKNTELLYGFVYRKMPKSPAHCYFLQKLLQALSRDSSRVTHEALAPPGRSIQPHVALLTLAAFAAWSTAQAQSSRPDAHTQPAIDLRLASGTLNGMVAPNNLAALAWFEWEERSGFTLTTSPESIGVGEVLVRVNAFQGYPESAYSVWGSTNLVTWDFLGLPVQGSPGVFQFLDDSAANLAQRFYRVSTP